jgi:hypothetical protein
VENLFSEEISLNENKKISTEINFNITLPSSNHPKKEDFISEGLSGNSWNISFFHMEQHVSYGPLSSDKILVFLKNMYATLSPEEKSMKNFMIVDIANDVYFQPDTLYEILSEEFTKKKAKLSVEKEKLIEIKHIPQPELDFPSGKFIRPLVPSVLSKYNCINNDKQIGKPGMELQMRKNSNLSSSSNCASTKHSSTKSTENSIVGLDSKKIRNSQKKNLHEKQGMF